MLKRNAEHQTQLGMYLIESIDIYSDTSLHRFPFLIHFFQKESTHTKHTYKKTCTKKNKPSSTQIHLFPPSFVKNWHHTTCVTLCFKQAQGAVWWLLRSWDRSTLQRPQDIERRPPHVYDSTWFFEKKHEGWRLVVLANGIFLHLLNRAPKKFHF